MCGPAIRLVNIDVPGFKGFDESLSVVIPDVH
jgi:hypothetical protein